jgi:GNAT superfamily N-acetyltransferase
MSSEADWQIIEADLALPEHQWAVMELTAAYARDPMGNGGPLEAEVMERLIAGLRSYPTTRIFLAWEQQKPIGIATCFLGFSTFAARPLINIHDLAVLPEYRGRGVGRRLLEAVESNARQWGCCKITLEVLHRNHAARGLYERAGFGPRSSDSAHDQFWFLWKPL